MLYMSVLTTSCIRSCHVKPVGVQRHGSVLLKHAKGQRQLM